MRKLPAIPAPLKPFRKSAWKPKTEERAGPRSQSKFAGLPWIPPGEPWPECPNCGEPMQLFFQLNLSQIPGELAAELGTGMLQLFYCINDEMTCENEQEGWQPFSANSIVRILPLEGRAMDRTANPSHHLGGSEGLELPSDLALELPPEPVSELLPEPASEPHQVESAFPEKIITGWHEILDYPDPEEAEDMGAVLSDTDFDTLEALEEKGLAVPRDGDKLWGWPFWAQSAEYPDCPICADRMRLVMQLDSGDNLPFSFGDAGCGHITQCERHRDQLAFAWACS